LLSIELVLKALSRGIVTGFQTEGVFMVNEGYKQQNMILTTKEVAGMLGVHNNTVRRWSDQGFLKSYRVTSRGDRRFKFEDIYNFLNKLNNGSVM